MPLRRNHSQAPASVKKKGDTENKHGSSSLLVDTVNKQDQRAVHLKTILGVFQDVEKELQT